MKKSLFALFILFILLSKFSTAQTGLEFGFKAGMNIATQYGINQPNIPYDVDSDARYGFTTGIILSFPITDVFSVQQEFLYTAKGSRQQVTMTQPPISTYSEYNINYFELPIIFRYNFVNIGNAKIFGSSGFALSMLLSGKYSVDGVIDMGQVQVPFSESGNTDGLDTFDYSFIYGLGMEFNLFNQKCFFDYRQTIGWNTLMMPSSEGGEPVPLRNQTYTFALGIFL
ncbi:MAG: PorT family protein [Bacteroidetes bacterium]|nr:PorT family protein [Bacteroidota bacterium]